MIPKNEVKELLSIVIITYNRAALLERTLIALFNSPFKACNITVLNNCSTDNTLDVCAKFANNGIQVRTNKYNIGLGANILRAFELPETEYVWILADDDTYDFSQVDDVVEVMKEGEVDLIHVGAIATEPWPVGGEYISPHAAYNRGYPYFRYSSFIPCNIFKVKSFVSSLIDGYNNIVNCYPHIPFLIHLFENNGIMYCARNRMVHAGIGAQNYNTYILSKWWLGSCYLAKDKDTRRKMLFDQFRHTNGRPSKIECMYEVIKRGKSNGQDIIWGYFKNLSLREKLRFSVSIPAKIVGMCSFRIKNRLKEK